MAPESTDAAAGSMVRLQIGNTLDGGRLASTSLKQHMLMPRIVG